MSLLNRSLASIGHLGHALPGSGSGLVCGMYIALNSLHMVGRRGSVQPGSSSSSCFPLLIFLCKLVAEVLQLAGDQHPLWKVVFLLVIADPPLRSRCREGTARAPRRRCSRDLCPSTPPSRGRIGWHLGCRLSVRTSRRAASAGGRRRPRGVRHIVQRCAWTPK
ncbi:uncharacterized protein LAESUDRAFT_86243 [Laetiporus sulphureus 93-53]|uniref:Uncharacterized protein n=1 Tax=Laetiporus sulphureus 93-53 TaxID=1314785 RepID=A0A165EVI2_9APHY|nr:uncharacterized protein LAESUDRAFT_86243 [Laetiporus sulphureus 93-53]KZT07851.1 hypothetical protein LAESUDRAFT_86243 [Laetiporus sulphureus 93-53]